MHWHHGIHSCSTKQTSLHGRFNQVLHCWCMRPWHAATSRKWSSPRDSYVVIQSSDCNVLYCQGDQCWILLPHCLLQVHVSRKVAQSWQHHKARLLSASRVQFALCCLLQVTCTIALCKGLTMVQGWKEFCSIPSWSIHWICLLGRLWKLVTRHTDAVKWLRARLEPPKWHARDTSCYDSDHMHRLWRCSVSADILLPKTQRLSCIFLTGHAKHTFSMFSQIYCTYAGCSAEAPRRVQVDACGVWEGCGHQLPHGLHRWLGQHACSQLQDPRSWQAQG